MRISIREIDAAGKETAEEIRMGRFDFAQRGAYPPPASTGSARRFPNLPCVLRDRRVGWEGSLSVIRFHVVKSS